MALARGAAAAGALALLGPRGPRALARVDAGGVRARPARARRARGRGRVAAAAAAWGGGPARGDDARRAERRQGGEVPRDPRRRARPSDGQALARGLALRGP